MIDIIKLSEKDIGKCVIYKGFCKIESGRIKSFNKKYIFVVYNCDNDWENFEYYTSEATPPENLFFTKMKFLSK